MSVVRSSPDHLLPADASHAVVESAVDASVLTGIEGREGRKGDFLEATNPRGTVLIGGRLGYFTECGDRSAAFWVTVADLRRNGCG